jgi:hypothetical protein
VSDDKEADGAMAVAQRPSLRPNDAPFGDLSAAMGPFMQEMGAPWIARQAAELAPAPVWVLLLTEAGLSNTTSTLLMKGTTEYSFAAKTQFKAGDGSLHPASLSFDEQGRLCTLVEHTKGAVRTTYSVADGVLTCIITLTKGGASEPVLKVKRVFLKSG